MQDRLLAVTCGFELPFLVVFVVVDVGVEVYYGVKVDFGVKVASNVDVFRKIFRQYHPELGEDLEPPDGAVEQREAEGEKSRQKRP